MVFVLKALVVETDLLIKEKIYQQDRSLDRSVIGLDLIDTSLQRRAGMGNLIGVDDRIPKKNDRLLRSRVGSNQVEGNSLEGHAVMAIVETTLQMATAAVTTASRDDTFTIKGINKHAFLIACPGFK